MKKLIASVVIINLCTLVAMAGGDEKAKPILEGSWRLTALTINGTKEAESETAESAVVVTFKEGKYAFTYKGEKGDVGTYKLDPKAKPATIDLTLTEGNSKGLTQRGIYKLEADQITFAFDKVGGTERPKNFEDKKIKEVAIFKRSK